MIAADIVWINWKDYTGLEFFFYGVRLRSCG